MLHQPHTFEPPMGHLVHWFPFRSVPPAIGSAMRVGSGSGGAGGSTTAPAHCMHSPRAITTSRPAGPREHKARKPPHARLGPCAQGGRGRAARPMARQFGGYSTWAVLPSKDDGECFIKTAGQARRTTATILRRQIACLQGHGLRRRRLSRHGPRNHGVLRALRMTPRWGLSTDAACTRC